jgi:hypothetical protein
MAGPSSRICDRLVNTMADAQETLLTEIRDLVAGAIERIDARADDRDTGLREPTCEVQRRLSTQLDDHAADQILDPDLRAEFDEHLGATHAPGAAGAFEATLLVALPPLGFTAEEQRRFEDFQDNNPSVVADAPLIRRGLTKADCLGALAKNGIEIPAMYKLGYKNNNCIGCVKGGAGYWNKIRRDFPDVFEKMAQVEEHLGRTINQTRVGGERKRITLRELDPAAGRYEEEADISCGVVCNGISDRIFMNDLA